MVAVLEAGEPVHRDDLDRVAPGLRALTQPLLERLLGSSFDHVQQPGRAGPVTVTGEVDDDGDVRVAAPGVAKDLLIDPDDLHPIQACRVVDQHPSALSQHSVVGGVP